MEQLVDKVEILFEKESAIFHDGDHVTGLVLINNNDDIAYKCERSSRVLYAVYYTISKVYVDLYSAL